MTDDIVARLRAWSADESTWDLLTEAADEIERLQVTMDVLLVDRRAALSENHDLWREIERLRAALKRIAQHDMQAIAMDALRPDERIRPAKEASDDAAT
jgi:hypothetical protein